MEEFDCVPQGMKDRDLWVNWVAVEKPGKDKLTKVPKKCDGKPASTRDSGSWSDFESARSGVHFMGLDGVGIVFDPADNLVGFDFDNCFDDAGELRDDVRDMVERLDSYTEVSPSGKGLHVYVEGELPGKGRNLIEKGLEVYDRDRYFTVTGEPFEFFWELKANQDAIDYCYHKYYGGTEVSDTVSVSRDTDESVSDLDEFEGSMRPWEADCIRNGTDKEGNPVDDRSSAVWGMMHVLMRAGANNESILSILSNPDYELSRAALDRRGGNIMSAREWLWTQSLSKARAEFDADRVAVIEDSFDDLDDELDDEEVSRKAEEKPGDQGELLDKARARAAGRIKVGPIPMDEDFELNAMAFLRAFPVTSFQDQLYVYRGDCWVHITKSWLEYMVTKAASGKGLKMATQDNTIKYVKRSCCSQEFKQDKSKLAFRNGTVSLAGWDTGTIDAEWSNHRKEDWITSLLDYEYDPAAKAPKWEKFIHDTFEGDQQRIDLLQEHLGYALVWDKRFQKILVMTGASRSGKGVICKVMRRLIGDLAYAGTNLEPLAGTFGLEGLLEAKVCVIEDAHSANKNKIERVKEILLNVSSGDTISIDRKNKPSLHQSIEARMIIVANRVPTFMDAYDALLNRYNVVAFQRSMAGKEDVGLENKLYAELPGIFNWAVQGLLRLGTNQKFTHSDLGDALKLEIQDRQNAEGSFVKRYLRFDPAARTVCEDVQNAYSRHCANLDRPPKTQREFGQFIKNLDGVSRARGGLNGGRVYFYTGVKLLPVKDDDLEDFDDLDD